MVRFGSIRLVLVRYGLVRLRGHGSAGYDVLSSGMFRQGGHGTVAFGRVSCVKAVGERFGEVWSVELSLVKANLIL